MNEQSQAVSPELWVETDQGVLERRAFAVAHGLAAPDPATLSAPKARRSLRESIGYPSARGLVVAALASFVPLAWPLLLYMALRYLTGHRAPRLASATIEGAAHASPTRAGLVGSHEATRKLAAIAALTVGALVLFYRISAFWRPAVACAQDWWNPQVAPCRPSGAHLDPFVVRFLVAFIAQAAIAAVVTFLAIAALRWAWISLRVDA
jgi:hypothetical protein